MRPHTAPEKQHLLSLETGGEVAADSGREDTPVVHDQLMEQDNLRRAFRQVKRNKGSAGIDGMTVDDLTAFVPQHWPRIAAQLLAGDYRPQPVRPVGIPQPKGGVRKLGIPTVLDRLIQQALLQWRLSQSPGLVQALPRQYFVLLGLPDLVDR